MQSVRSHLQWMRSGKPALISKHLGFAPGASTPSTTPAGWTPPCGHSSRLWSGVVLVQACML